MIRQPLPRPALAAALMLASLLTPFARADTYDAHYRAEVRPAEGTVRVEIRLAGAKLPSKIVMSIDPRRHRGFKSTDDAVVAGEQVTWRPLGRHSRLSYEFVVNHERTDGKFDSLLTRDWAIFRGDKLVPSVRVTAVKGLESRSTLEFVLPRDWAETTAYPATSAGYLQIDDPDRRFDRPRGWMLVGKLGKRSELIAGVQTIVSAPAGDAARRQDTLSFLNWNLPHLVEVFPDFPKRVLVVSAGDPMWRGGLSGPASLFLHSSRPLISENRTSTLLHELVHVAMRIHGDEESDWIVEGFAEYYSVETLRRSGGISQRRYEEALARLDQWGQRSIDLFATRSSGATTARAVIALKEADEEIRAATRGKASLDDVARALAARGGAVDLELLQKTAQKVAGRPVRSLERKALSGQSTKPAPAR